MSSEVQFWLWMLLLNSILFLPRFLMEWQETAFFPFQGLRRGSLFERVRFLSYRYNYDLFRFCFDWFVGCFVLYLFRHTLDWPFWSWGIFAFYWLLLLQLIYFNLFDKVFNLPPLFYNDTFMLWHGLKIAFTGFLFWTLLALVGLVAFAYFLFWSIEQMLGQLAIGEFGLGSIVAFAFVFAFGLFSHWRYSYEQLPQQTVQSPLRSMRQNIQASLKAKRKLGGLSIDRLKQYNWYEHFTLVEKPNIYFIVVESYGRILLDDPAFDKDYAQWMHNHEQSLAQKGWAMSSALSTPPIVGGASWLSYSSLLYGFRIDNQGTYLALSNNPQIDQYQSFFRWLQQQGYKNYQLNALGGFEKMKIPWETYQRYYAVEEWILYKDLEYHGQLYGFGPSPPDQYSLNFAAEHIRKKNRDPFSLFYITQNSHSPFESPQSIATDWTTLNEQVPPTAQQSKFFEKPQKADYLKAMQYQMDCLVDFVQQQGQSNDVFVLIGDHQPPVLTPRESPQETPVHVIAHRQHHGFVKAFLSYGFSEGLLPKVDSVPIKHEAWYSLWMRCLLAHFAKADAQDLPPYCPNGLEFDVPNSSLDLATSNKST
ncbi:MAG: sulfatase-like hydrolase/transferase [Bacteroidota bacterium]